MRWQEAYCDGTNLFHEDGVRFVEDGLCHHGNLSISNLFPSTLLRNTLLKWMRIAQH